MRPNLSVEIAGIRMRNPVMNASGTFSMESAEVKALSQAERIGAFVQKSITLKPREGNLQPRIYEVEGGVINRIGLENVGVIEFVSKKLPALSSLEMPLIVSVAGESIEDYVRTAVILETESNGLISALEINVSCPNVQGGLVFGCDFRLLWELVKSLRVKIKLPLIVKLTPNVTSIANMAETAVYAGADALSLINTVKAAAYIRWGPNAGQWIDGGLSGPAIKTIALSKVREVAKAVNVPIIAMGGIRTTGDALNFLRIKNVKAIAVGTANFLDPLAMVKIIKGLENYLAENNYADISDLKSKEA